MVKSALKLMPIDSHCHEKETIPFSTML